MIRIDRIGKLVIAGGVGFALGAAGALSYSDDVSMAASVGTGLTTGICATIEAARSGETPLHLAAAERLLQRTADTFPIAGNGPDIPATVEACDAAIAKLRDGRD